MNALFVGLLLLGGGAFEEGLRAYREGRFAEALEAFVAAEAAAGEDASGELLFNQALAALRAGDPARAEAAAERAAARGGDEFAALREFVRGNAAFARCEAAAAALRAPGAGPEAMGLAIAHAEEARTAWARAAATRPDWPEARRNAERAALELERLLREKASAEAAAQPDGARRAAAGPNVKPRFVRPPIVRPSRPAPRLPSPDAPADSEPAPGVAPSLVERSPADVWALLETLDRKEEEKLALRRTRRRAREADVERDW